jgi:hypothetical protein
VSIFLTLIFGNILFGKNDLYALHNKWVISSINFRPPSSLLKNLLLFPSTEVK